MSLLKTLNLGKLPLRLCPAMQRTARVRKLQPTAPHRRHPRFLRMLRDKQDQACSRCLTGRPAEPQLPF
jgi:hypothetical protein